MRRTLVAFLWRRHRLSLCLCLFIPLFVGTAIGFVAPHIQAQRDAFASLPFLQRFLGSDAASAFSSESLLSFPMRHPLVLLLYAVFPAIAALGLPAGERGQGGLDLILAAPVERRALVQSVALFAALTAPAVMVSCFLGSMLAAFIANQLGGLDVTRFALAVVPAGGLIVFWSGVALTASVLARNRTSATLAFAVVVAVAFILDSTARLSPDAAWLAYLSPYGYYRPDQAILGQGSWAAQALGLAASGAVLVALATELEVHRRSA